MNTNSELDTEIDDFCTVIMEDNVDVTTSNIVAVFDIDKHRAVVKDTPKGVNLILFKNFTESLYDTMGLYDSHKTVDNFSLEQSIDELKQRVINYFSKGLDKKQIIKENNLSETEYMKLTENIKSCYFFVNDESGEDLTIKLIYKPAERPETDGEVVGRLRETIEERITNKINASSTFDRIKHMVSSLHEHEKQELKKLL